MSETTQTIHHFVFLQRFVWMMMIGFGVVVVE
jgi:hypothetical protein